jgi:hypothetical protein
MITEASVSDGSRRVDRMGRSRFWVAVSTAVVAATAFAVAITTPPRTGPYCRSDCIVYPYTGGADFVPRDFWWMYPESLVALLAVVLVAGLSHRAGPGAALSGRVSTILAAIGAGVLVSDYALQLTVVQPSLLKGETDGLALLSQYNPHGVFIGVENVGYLLFGLAFLGAAAAMEVPSRLLRAARAVFMVGGAVTVVALVGYAAAYGADLDYRFEVAGIGVDWLVLFVTGILLSLGTGRRSAVGRRD